MPNRELRSSKANTKTQYSPRTAKAINDAKAEAERRILDARKGSQKRVTQGATTASSSRKRAASSVAVPTKPATKAKKSSKSVAENKPATKSQRPPPAANIADSEDEQDLPRQHKRAPDTPVDSSGSESAAEDDYDGDKQASESDGDDEDLNNLDPYSLAAALDHERLMVVDDTLDDGPFGASGGEIEMAQGTGEKPESEWACSVERMSSRNTSGPPSETGNDADEARIVKVKGKKTISKCSQRDSAFAKELPCVAPITVPEAAKPPKTKNESRVWTQVSQLIQPISGKKLPLLKQSDEVQLVVQGAIDNTEASFLMDDPFPTSKQKVETARQGLLMSAEDVAKKYRDVQEIADRLGVDLSFAAPLGELVLDRVATNRSVFFKKAAVPAIAYYQLGTDEVCKVRYKALCDSGRPRYVFVGKWGFNAKGEETYKIMVSKPYFNPAIITTAKYFFANPKSIGNRLFPRFKSSIKDAQEREMPATIVALVATAVFAALHRWCDGKLDTNVEFSGTVFRTTYNNHLEDIKRYKTDYPAESHATFVNLLEECKPDSASGGTVAGSSGSGLAALMANGDD